MAKRKATGQAQSSGSDYNYYTNAPLPPGVQLIPIIPPACDYVEAIVRALREQAGRINSHPFGRLVVEWDTARPLHLEITTKHRAELTPTK